jgi:hypothetical protein
LQIPSCLAKDVLTLHVEKAAEHDFVLDELVIDFYHRPTWAPLRRLDREQAQPEHRIDGYRNQILDNCG